MPAGEASKGTNAIGTALAEQSEVQVLGNQHFFAQHSFLSCSACPLLGPDGQLLGVLDISTDAAHHDGDMLGTVRLLAMTLENALLARQPGWLVDLEPQSLWSARLLLGRRASCSGPTGPVGSGSASTPSTASNCCGIGAACGWYRKLIPWRPSPACHRCRRLARPAGAAQDAGARHLAAYRGETGSGKEHLVRELHGQSSRRAQPLVCVNCGALPAELVEAELFGYIGGAFSGARSQGSQGICAPPTAAS